MNEGRITGEARRAKGAVEEAVGKITGDSISDAERAAQKAVGETEGKAAEMACRSPRRRPSARSRRQLPGPPDS